MGRSKLDIELGGGVKLGALALEAALRTELDSVVVVLREGSAAWLPEAFLEAERAGRGLRTVCGESDGGMAYSLRHGLRMAQERWEPDAVLVLLADQPLVGAELISRLLRTYDAAGAVCDYCAASYREQLLPPVLLGSPMFPAVERLTGDEGARALLRLPQYKGELVREREEQRFWDADTPEDADRIGLFFQGHR
ncbi:NTP transferase domain-containing protein [Paenibacillus filicis]|uniref:NTP transferase domain-containing protein n=1 Tax=Paenibacillus gyeongsangnamensis TaxID=3388067 RepID=A0ABT4QGH3_9BACL|nr:NTP transferase domain-containing protein [Paenibacillus filicis]MCZ8515989.1 NTP transferase domain-containing protein [Paenibacillus filicis]